MGCILLCAKYFYENFKQHRGKKRLSPVRAASLAYISLAVRKRSSYKAVLWYWDGWADVSALLMKVLKQLNELSTFPAESLIEIFRFIQSIFLAKKALHANEWRTLWNAEVNAGVAAEEKHSSHQGIARYKSITRLLWDYLGENFSCVVVCDEESIA